MTKSEQEFRDSLRDVHEEISDIHELMQRLDYDLGYLPWVLKCDPSLAPHGMLEELQTVLDLYRSSDLLNTAKLVKNTLSDCLKMIGGEHDVE